MTISPVYQIGQTTQISKESPRKISLYAQNTSTNTGGAKDTITISAAARNMAAQMASQKVSDLSAHSLNASQQSQLAIASAAQTNPTTTQTTVRVQTARQKDLAAFLSGKAFQEEFSESMLEKLQEKLSGDTD